MADIRVVRMSNGYIISRTETGKRPQYVHKVSRNRLYVWYSDYTYARRFGRRAAEKHADVLKFQSGK